MTDECSIEDSPARNRCEKLSAHPTVLGALDSEVPDVGRAPQQHVLADPIVDGSGHVVALFELDFAAGACGYYLDIENGYDLTAVLENPSRIDVELVDIIRNGIPGTAMPGTFFDGTQVWQIVAYLRSL